MAMRKIVNVQAARYFDSHAYDSAKRLTRNENEI